MFWGISLNPQYAKVGRESPTGGWKIHSSQTYQTLRVFLLQEAEFETNPHGNASEGSMAAVGFGSGLGFADYS